MGRKKHRALLWTCEHALTARGHVLVVFTHHHLAERDLIFFEGVGVGVR